MNYVAVIIVNNYTATMSFRNKNITSKYILIYFRIDLHTDLHTELHNIRMMNEKVMSTETRIIYIIQKDEF